MLDAAGAARLARQHFALDGTASPLAGEHDLNFRLRTAGGDYVLKAHRGTQSVSLDCQDAMLAYLADGMLAVPRPRTAVTGGHGVAVEVDGDAYWLRCLGWIDGSPWANATLDPVEGPWSLGQALADLDRALAGFVPGIDEEAFVRRDFDWDMLQATQLRADLARVEPASLRRRLQDILDRFENHCLPRLLALPWQWIHNDANDHNVMLVDGRVHGLIDFGDITRGPRVVELAVALAYAMGNQADPLGMAARIVAGYHQHAPLDAEEIELLPPLVETRAAMSLLVNARLMVEQPDNAHLRLSQAPFRALLERLQTENPVLARARLRTACGLPADAASGAVTAYLRSGRAQRADICRHRLDDPDRLLVFDLGGDGPHADALRDLDGSEAWTTYLFDAMARAGASVGLGRYLEKRSLYQADAYATADPAERRDRHLGVDLFLPAGEAIHAPLHGVVEALADNRVRQDFGPTVILRHVTDDGTPFFTLYGHMSRETLSGLAIGQAVAAGEVLGTVGDREVNGDWPPHLHFQLMTSLLGMGTDVHGVGHDAALDAWRGIFLDPQLVLHAAADLAAPLQRGSDALRLRRRVRLGRMLSLAGDPPLNIVRGRGQYLFDEHGNRYLDMVNNVCHVGHCHPRVVAAGQQQMARLNTNTRYLHDHIIALADRLVETLPEPLSVCFFVNSGSEANDLALRLARAHTGADDVLVLDHAYHGHLSSTLAVSPYKFQRAGGAGRPPGTRVCPLPDAYREGFRRDDAKAGRRHARSVAEAVAALRDEQRRPAAFIAESVGGVAGQVVLPDGYLQAAYGHARDAGAVCIADEVQVGLGRMGRVFWGFQTQGVVPDIVTVGKPLGNGHPVAAVITTAAIARSFDNGMEYFNTFGGNPVSCQVALAVLDAIDADDLMHNARERGRQLVEGLEALANRHALIGDVRGIGLFVGAELVRDRDTLAPATDEARALVAHARRRGILLSTDGPLDNVLKMKPPMCLTAADIDHLLTVVDDGLGSLDGPRS